MITDSCRPALIQTLSITKIRVADSLLEHCISKVFVLKTEGETKSFPLKPYKTYKSAAVFLTLCVCFL